MIEEPMDEVILNEEPREINQSKEENFEEIKKLKFDYDSLMDKYLRAMSEIENMNKRILKDREDMLKYGISSFAKDLIPFVDNLERAILAENQKENLNFINGISIILSDVIKSFLKHGVKKIEVKSGDDFNPEFHDAVSVVSSSKIQSGKIVEKFFDGYKLEDRVIRASLVSVAE